MSDTERSGRRPGQRPKGEMCLQAWPRLTGRWSDRKTADTTTVWGNSLQAERGWSCVVTSVRCSTVTIKPNQLGETIMKKDYDTPPLNAEINSLLWFNSLKNENACRLPRASLTNASDHALDTLNKCVDCSGQSWLQTFQPYVDFRFWMLKKHFASSESIYF